MHLFTTEDAEETEVNLVHACMVLILFIYIPLCTVSAYSNKGIFSLQ